MCVRVCVWGGAVIGFYGLVAFTSIRAGQFLTWSHSRHLF